MIKNGLINEDIDGQDRQRAQNAVLKLRGLMLYKRLMKEPNSEEIIEELQKYHTRPYSYPLDDFMNCITFIHNEDGIKYFSIKINGMHNYLREDGTFVSDIWFNFMYWFDGNGLSRVMLDAKYNFIDKNGKLLMSTWYEYCDNFDYGFAMVLKGVKNKAKYNYIDTNGELLWKQPFSRWFDDSGPFMSNGLAVVYKAHNNLHYGLKNLLRSDGTLVSRNVWFHKILIDAEEKSDMFTVYLKDKRLLMDINGLFYNKDGSLLDDSLQYNKKT